MSDLIDHRHASNCVALVIYGNLFSHVRAMKLHEATSTLALLVGVCVPCLARAAVFRGGAAVATDDVTRFDHLRSSAVRIQSVSAAFDWLQPFVPGSDQVSIGSGFLVQTEPYPLIVTNEHVVNDAKFVSLQLLLFGEQLWDAEVVSVCPKFDLALIVLRDPEGFRKALDSQDIKLAALELAEGAPQMGQDVVALGFPLGQDSLKISKGNIAGNEDVDGNICIQSTAPISPGSSGGPLLNEDGTKVVGVNFAKATEGENINYVIPAWRVKQIVAKHLKDQPYKPGTSQKWKRLRVQVPLPEVTAIESNDALYTLSKGCKAGIHFAKIGARSFFQHAEPRVEDRSFLVSVNGFKLDSFGTGLNEEYAADRVAYPDLFFMVPDLTTDVEFETCTKGRTQKHRVSMAWREEYGSGIRYVDEPNVEGVSSAYELFGDVAVMEMTVNHVNAILGTSGDPAPARWLHPDSVAQARLMVNYVRSGSYAADVVSPGAAVTKVNGHEVYTLKEFGERFVPEDESVWTLETDTGRVVAMMFNKSLGEQIQKAEFERAPHLLTPSVVNAAGKLGFAISPDAMGVEEVATDQKASNRDSGHKTASALAVAQSLQKLQKNKLIQKAAGPLLVHGRGLKSATRGKFTSRGAKLSSVRVPA